jgi:hypothetical protein
MGKTARVTGDYFTVTAVLKDLPANTRFNFEYILPWLFDKKGMDDQNWGNNNVLIYILLKPGATGCIYKKIRNITIDHTRWRKINYAGIHAGFKRYMAL